MSDELLYAMKDGNKRYFVFDRNDYIQVEKYRRSIVTDELEEEPISNELYPKELFEKGFDGIEKENERKETVSFKNVRLLECSKDAGLGISNTIDLRIEMMDNIKTNFDKMADLMISKEGRIIKKLSMTIEFEEN